MKNYDSWNIEKKALEEDKAGVPIFHEREIWWCSIGYNLGYEQDGKNELFERPVLVLKKFNNKVCWILPMTTKNKEGIYYFQTVYEEKTFSIILSQLRLVSVKRFRRYIRKISPNQFEKIQNRIIGMIIRDV